MSDAATGLPLFAVPQPYSKLALTQSQRDVLYVFVTDGAATDEQMIARYHRHRETGVNLTMQTESGLRSRRAELRRKGLIEACGRELLSTGNRGTIHRVVR